MNWICLNGKFIRGDKPALQIDNRGFRYGDALFETMKVVEKKILLSSYHFERLFNGLRLLQFRNLSVLNKKRIIGLILELCKKNKCEDLARVRLTVFRGNGNLYDKEEAPQYIVECSPLAHSKNELNKKGLVIDIFPDTQKSCDIFSNLKSANYLPYVMASRFAIKNKLDDCLVCNTKGRIADATIANIFLIKENLIITPALTEGCVSGVMRRYLLEKLKQSGFEIREGVVTRNDMKSFDEVFFTNAISGIRWVKSFADKIYSKDKTSMIFKEFIEPLYL